MDPRVAANRALWNEWTPIHVRSAFYDVEGWKSGGRVDLYPLLVSEVGDVAGKDLLHLQCHFGLDTLAWPRRGARVTGADISERAIEQARVLAGETEPSSGVWRLPEPDDARLPLLYSLKATRD
jgi:2-polyprenyl-3-methyl-5-hydroxy-6-metoxy-1,4-benzoquinol methylase